MATSKQTKSTRSAKPSVSERSDMDSARWVVGLVLFTIGVSLLMALVSYLFNWEADQSGLMLSEEVRDLEKLEPGNAFGWQGAKIGDIFIGRSFGLFGILLPFIVAYWGIRIIRKKGMFFNHFVMIMILIMLLGSLTLGCMAGDWLNFYGTGLGGAFGLSVAAEMRSAVGGGGSVMGLLLAWVLLGVFINRNFINKVNTVGQKVANTGENIFGKFRDTVVNNINNERERIRNRGEEPQEDESQDDEPQEKVPQPEPKNQEERELPTPTHTAPALEQPEEQSVSQPEEQLVTVNTLTGEIVDTPVSVVPEEQAPEMRAEQSDDDSDFEVVGVNGERTEVEPTVAEPVIEIDQDPFVTVPIGESNESDRIVMGPSGMIELARPLDAVQSVSDDEDPFTVVPLDEPTPRVDLVLEPKPARTAQVQTTTLDQDDYPFKTEIIEPTVAQPTVAQPSAVAPVADVAPQSAPMPGSEPLVITVEANEPVVVEEKLAELEAYDPTKDLINYKYPSASLLEDYDSSIEVNEHEILFNKSKIQETLLNFGIPIVDIKATVGPTVTLYELVQAQGVKISKIQGLENDIAQSLKALGIRIIAPIPGKGTIGIEVPNKDKKIVSMFSAIRSRSFLEMKAELPVVIGRNIQNEVYSFDLAKMPHLLVAGATGQGKSVGLNAIITSLLYRKHPSQLKFVMIDPKMVEFSLYSKIENHFLAKMESEDEAIVTDPRKAVNTLNSLCGEMDKRLELCKRAGARNIVEYNEKFTARRLNPNNGHSYMPYIVVVVDEFADLIMTAKEVEGPVMRLAQKARAVGIHLIIATQRPDVKVITGGIKANFPARIAFRVMQMIDSRTIIDQPGANQLIGRGDLLFSKDGVLTRIQCALIETNEVERVVEYIESQQSYTTPYLLPDYVPESSGAGVDMMGSEDSGRAVKYDALFAEIARTAVTGGAISVSMIQRNFEVGFNRAGRIMMQLERAGVVGRQEGAKPRDILFHDIHSLEAKLQELGVF